MTCLAYVPPQPPRPANSERYDFLGKCIIVFMDDGLILLEFKVWEDLCDLQILPL